MTVRECYDALGGDFDGVLLRFRKEENVKKFALKYLNDSSVEALDANINCKNTEDAFRAAHSLKGVCANLGFSRLFDVAATITEMLRSGDLESAASYFPEVKKVHDDTAAALNRLKDEM